MIQKSASVSIPVYQEFPKRVAKMWLDEAAKAGEDLDMADEEDKNEDVGESKKHRNMFKAKNG